LENSVVIVIVAYVQTRMLCKHASILMALNVQRVDRTGPKSIV
jgi:hypothetical protein